MTDFCEDFFGEVGHPEKLWWCKTCGAYVISRSLHSDWHVSESKWSGE